MSKNRLPIIAIILFISILINIRCFNPQLIYDDINISKIWKHDTCGIYGHRLKITPIILRHSHKMPGYNAEKIIKIFGQPDFIQKSNLVHSNTTLLIYSTSSMEIIGAKCGDPVVRSLGFFIDNKTGEVVDVKEFIS